MNLIRPVLEVIFFTVRLRNRIKDAFKRSPDKESTKSTKSAKGVKVELNLAHFMPSRHPMDRGVMTPFATEISSATNGELNIVVHPAGEMGKGPVQQYKRVVSGAVDIAFGIPAYTPNQFPKTALMHLPGLFENVEMATNAIWKNIQNLEDEYREVKLLALWANNPAVCITREKPVQSMEDFKGLKVRAPNPVMAKVVAAWGATPVSMPITEIFNAMNTGVIDAVIMGPSGIRSYKMHDVARFITTNIPASVDSFYIVMNMDRWNYLSEEHRTAFENAVGPNLSMKGAKEFYMAGQAALKLATDAKVQVIEASKEAVDEMRKAMEDPIEKHLEQLSRLTGTDTSTVVAGFKS